jgi:cytochrome c
MDSFLTAGETPAGPRNALILGSFALAFAGQATVTLAMDEEAMRALMRKSDCFKCHAIDRKKDGPPYKEVARKYKDKADAEDKLFIHLTTHPKVEVDYVEEEHVSLKTKDESEIRGVIQWILTR